MSGYIFNTVTSNNTNMGTITTNPFINQSPVYTISDSTSPNYNWSHTDTISVNDYSKALHVNGDANFDGEITVKGKKLSNTLERIEERLNILTVNPELESRWEKLSKLGEEYRKLEKELLEQEKIFEILSK